MASVPARKREEGLQAVKLETVTQRLAERVEHTCSLRRVPDETVEELKRAGLFRLLQPARWGGAEAHPNHFFDTQRAIARACASTGWVYGVVTVHAWQLALFPLQAQEDVWGEDPDALISSSYAPTGKVEKAPGGYRISGRWSFSSGCDHCGWVFVGGFAPSDGPPDMRTFLVPRSDYTIEDNWHTFALQGTGSKDIVMNEVFVPEHRTHRFADGFRCLSPGNEQNHSTLANRPEAPGRMDDRAWRIQIVSDPSDDLLEVGWELPDHEASRLEDPAGVPLVINEGKTELYGFPVDLAFFHVNPRHHSLAFGGPQRKRLHHFMIEASSMDEVGLCYDRAIRAGVRIMQTLGRHPNDRMFSFYARTPSGFQFEFGWGGRTIDDATWTPTTYDRVSEWGHHPPQVIVGPRDPR